MNKIDASGAILIGGNSRRFGLDKSKLDWQGTALPVSLFHRLDTILTEVFFIADHKEKINGFQQYMFTDILTNNGPLGGIHSALKHSHYDYTFITAGDLPFLDTALIPLLFNEIQDEDALVPVWGTNMEPLVAFYHKRCLPVLEEELKQQQREVHASLKKLTTQFLDLTRYYTIPQIKKIFFNINRPEDYQQALKMI